MSSNKILLKLKIMAHLHNGILCGHDFMAQKERHNTIYMSWSFKVRKGEDLTIYIYISLHLHKEVPGRKLIDGISYRSAKNTLF